MKRTEMNAQVYVFKFIKKVFIKSITLKCNNISIYNNKSICKIYIYIYERSLTNKIIPVLSSTETVKRLI